MRLRTAFEFVLGIATLYVKEHPDDPPFTAQQYQAIAKINKFVHDYDFEDFGLADEGKDLCDYCNKSDIEIKAVDKETGKVACSRIKHRANKEPIYARVDFKSPEGPKFVFVQLHGVDLDTDYNGEAAIYHQMREVGLDPNNIIGWSFYDKSEIDSDPTLVDLAAIFESAEIALEEDKKLADLANSFDGYGYGD